MCFGEPKREFDDPVHPPAHSAAFIRRACDQQRDRQAVARHILPGVDAKITQVKGMVFHAVGDTGRVKGTDTQRGSAAIMVKQIEDIRPTILPAKASILLPAWGRGLTMTQPYVYWTLEIHKAVSRIEDDFLTPQEWTN